MNKITGIAVTDVGCSTRVFYHECIEGLPLWQGMHRFLPMLIQANGFRAIEVPVMHRPRKKGHGKYGIANRVWVTLGDLWAVRWFRKRGVRPSVKES